MVEGFRGRGWGAHFRGSVYSLCSVTSMKGSVTSSQSPAPCHSEESALAGRDTHCSQAWSCWPEQWGQERWEQHPGHRRKSVPVPSCAIFPSMEKQVIQSPDSSKLLCNAPSHALS